MQTINIKTLKYQRIDKNLFIKNRKKFIRQMKPKALAIFNSNDVYPISADSTMPFQQHRDIFYLSGIDQPESILFLFPDCPEEHHKEIVFVRKTNEHIAIWEGKKLNKQDVFNISGIKTIYWLEDLDKILYQVMAQCDTVYVNTNEHYRAKVETQTREDRFIKKLKNKYLGHRFARSNPILQALRSVKEDIEIDLIQKACNITEKGFRRILNFVKPDVWEYEIEAELSHEFLRNCSKGFAYQPIIASGNNANVLHYIENNKQCKKGDLLLLDIAAEYANYSSDLSRTIPVSGYYTKRQKKIYNAVLRVKNEATKLLKVGSFIKDYHKQVGELMTKELLDLKLLEKIEVQNQTPENPAYKKYFMHGTSHHLGLDTHDYCVLTNPIQANMVFTVEPAIYLPREGFGIRLEDDVVVQEKGEPINLMKDIPIEAEHIEALMNA